MQVGVEPGFPFSNSWVNLILPPGAVVARPSIPAHRFGEDHRGARCGADFGITVVRDSSVYPRREPRRPGRNQPRVGREGGRNGLITAGSVGYSTAIPVCVQQQHSACNGYFESACYHTLLLFNREGDCLAAKLRLGNVHSGELEDGAAGGGEDQVPR